MSLAELEQLQKDVAKAITAAESTRKKDALKAAKAAAKEMGFDLEDLMSGGAKSSASVAPKYQHPENPELTWSGRGRKPKWYVEALESGKAEADLLIA